MSEKVGENMTRDEAKTRLERYTGLRLEVRIRLERLVERQEERERRLAASSTKHLAELLGLDAKELYGFFDDVQQ